MLGFKTGMLPPVSSTHHPASQLSSPNAGLCGKRVLDLIALGDDFGSLRTAVDGAFDRLLGGLVIVFLDLLVVGRIPVDEHADAAEQIVGFVDRDRAVSDA